MSDLYAQLRATLGMPSDVSVYIVAVDELTADANLYAIIAPSPEAAQEKFYTRVGEDEYWRRATIYRLYPSPSDASLLNWDDLLYLENTYHPNHGSQ